MKTPPSMPKTSSNGPKLESLSDIEEYLKKLKSEIRSGTLSSQDIDFIPIFHSIQEIVNAENLRKIIYEFQTSSDLFSRKIQDIRAYISSIGGKQEFEKYVKVQSEDSLNEVFQALYNPPFTVDDINLETLMSSFERLSNRKKIWNTIEFPDFNDVIRDATAEYFDGFVDDVHFERDLEKFEKVLTAKLPQSLRELLSSAPNEDLRYSYFVYCSFNSFNY